MRGTWQVTDPGRGGALVIIIAAVVILAASGAADAIVSAVVWVLIAAAAVFALTVAGGVAFLVYRARHERLVIPPARSAPTVAHQVRPVADRTAIEPPRELHLHFHGTDPEQVAEIIRRHQRREE